MLDLVFYERSSGKSPVEDYIEGLDDKAQALIYGRLKAFLEEFPEVQSVSVKPLRKKIWEIRVRDERKRNHRLLYAIVEDSLVILHAFLKKTPKTPKQEIELARKRLRSVIKG